MDQDEFIPSEVSNKRAVDIHHIHPKQMGGKKSFLKDGKTYDIDDISNLIALTRNEHNDAHDEKMSKDYLWYIHQRTIRNYLNVSKSKMQGKRK